MLLVFKRLAWQLLQAVLMCLAIAVQRPYTKQDQEGTQNINTVQREQPEVVLNMRTLQLASTISTRARHILQQHPITLPEPMEVVTTVLSLSKPVLTLTVELLRIHPLRS